MRKIVFVLSLILMTFSIPNVNALTKLDNPLDCFSIASPSSTKNMYLTDWGTKEKSCGYVNSIFYQYSSDTGSQYYCNNNFIEVEPNTTYTFTHFNNSFSPVQSSSYNNIYLFDENFNQLLKTQNWFAPPYNFTTVANSKYFLYCTYSSFGSFSNQKIQLEKGSISKNDLAYVEYEKKQELPPEDDIPIVADTTLDGFYSIYVSKLKELSDYVIENKFLLGTFGIILSFIVLEIILNLFRKGGYR